MDTVDLAGARGVAADAALASQVSGKVVWIVGGLARHAPDVPAAEVVSGDDGPMTTAVARACALARPDGVVLLAPAAASMDQFAAAVVGLRDAP